MHDILKCLIIFYSNIKKHSCTHMVVWFHEYDLMLRRQKAITLCDHKRGNQIMAHLYICTVAKTVVFRVEFGLITQIDKH